MHTEVTHLGSPGPGDDHGAGAAHKGCTVRVHIDREPYEV